MAFSDEEIAYLQSQPVANTCKLRNLGAGRRKVSLVADNLVSWSWNLAGEPAGDGGTTPGAPCTTRDLR